MKAILGRNTQLRLDGSTVSVTSSTGYGDFQLDAGETERAVHIVFSTMSGLEGISVTRDETEVPFRQGVDGGHPCVDAAFSGSVKVAYVDFYR